MAKGPEAKLKAACRAWMRAQGAYVFSPVQMGYGATTVDDLVCFRGRFIAFEYKRPDTRPSVTKRQAGILGLVLAAGGCTRTVYELNEVKETFASIDGEGWGE